jgi:hypothetical protein
VSAMAVGLASVVIGVRPYLLNARSQNLHLVLQPIETTQNVRRLLAGWDRIGCPGCLRHAAARLQETAAQQ